MCEFVSPRGANFFPELLSSLLLQQLKSACFGRRIEKKLQQVVGTFLLVHLLLLRSRRCRLLALASSSSSSSKLLNRRQVGAVNSFNRGASAECRKTLAESVCNQQVVAAAASTQPLSWSSTEAPLLAPTTRILMIDCNSSSFVPFDRFFLLPLVVGLSCAPASNWRRPAHSVRPLRCIFVCVCVL